MRTILLTLKPARLNTGKLVGSGSQGVALVIVLAFLVLVSGLIVAFFSRSILDRQISNSSASQAQVEFFAQGAMDSIIGDLKAEIVAGSETQYYVSDSGTTRLFVPGNNSSANQTGVPSLVGSTGSNGLQNLVKISAFGRRFFPDSPLYNFADNVKTITASATTSQTIRIGNPERAIQLSSTVPSLNGRFVSPARWNKPLLMEPTSVVNLEAKGFTAPDWILVTRSGSNSPHWSNDLRYSGSNPGSVVGRYAYAIYNEGGLLDANVAGYPSTSEFTHSNGKVASAYADLEQIGLSKERVDQIVSWRNFATTQASSFTNPGFTAASGSSYFQFVAGNPTGFLGTGTAVYNQQTDRAFLGRQQLLEFLRNCLALPANNPAYQSLGTFSRALNQPSFVPHRSRPRVSGSAYTAPSNSYSGGNTAFSKDDEFNPIFRSIRVQRTFARNDGTIAQVGEPLVKKRFALNRLCWITCEGPSKAENGVGASNSLLQTYIKQGVPAELLDQGTAANILKYFGLTYFPGPGSNGRGGRWIYSHVNNGNISPLKMLVNAREPDFFELLKASIVAGAVGKARAGIGFGLDYFSERYLYASDSSVDNQIIQIGANIINQASPDDFPRWIIFNNGTLNFSFWGVTDLPSLYGIFVQPVTVRQSDPPLTAANQTAPVLSTSAGFSPLVDGGLGTLMQFPVIWNPHAPGSSTEGIVAPGNLRIAVSHFSVAGVSAMDSSPLNFRSSFFPYVDVVSASGTTRVQNTVTIPAAPSLTPGYIPTPWAVGTYDSTADFLKMPQPGAPSNTALCFLNRSDLYREPTPLMQQNLPLGSELKLDANNLLATTPQLDASGNSTAAPYGQAGVKELNTGLNFTGFFVGQFPLRWSVAAGGTTSIYSANWIWCNAGRYGMTYSLEYDAGGGNWVPYQQKINDTFWGIGDGTALAVPYAPSLTGASRTASALNSNAPRAFSGFWEPRSRRWQGSGQWPATNLSAYMDESKTILKSFYPDKNSQDAPHGFFIGNASKDNFARPDVSPPWLQDADSIVRRPMGAWVPGGPSPSPAATNVGLPMVSVWNSSTQSRANANAYLSNRPLILHRPFRNVAELGYVYSSTPWRNLDFSTPESGFSSLLDTFCINDGGDANAMVAGKVDLNTRQKPVLMALLAGATRDELNPQDVAVSSEADAIANALLGRTTSTETGKGPFTNIAELVGRFSPGLPVQSLYCNGSISPYYDGFSSDLGGLYSGGTHSASNLVGRFRETAMRALSSTGQVGVWNLMIDVVVQVGRYPVTATHPSQFVVSGEKRLWIHVAIDRQTGNILDQQIETVNE